MHRSEEAELVACSDCGARVAPGPDRAFGFGNEGSLCWDCAIRRGGEYDATQERWTTPPRTTDLLPFRGEDA